MDYANSSERVMIVYQMGRLCVGAHEISGIPAPLWLHGWVVERSWGGWVGGWWLCGLWWGWVVVMWVVGGGGIEVGGVVHGGVGYYNFPRSTNKIKSIDEILTSEKNYIFLHFFFVVGEGQT